MQIRRHRMLLHHPFLPHSFLPSLTPQPKWAFRVPPSGGLFPTHQKQSPTKVGTLNTHFAFAQNSYFVFVRAVSVISWIVCLRILSTRSPKLHPFVTRTVSFALSTWQHTTYDMV